MHQQIAKTYRQGTLPVGLANADFNRRFHDTESAIDRLTDQSTEAECIEAMGAHLAVWQEFEHHCGLIAVIQHTQEKRWPEDHTVDGSAKCWCQG